MSCACVRVFLGTYGTEHKRQDLGAGGSDDKGCPMNKMQPTHPRYGDTQTAGMVVFEGLVPLPNLKHSRTPSPITTTGK